MIYWNNRSKQKTALRYLLFILFGFFLAYCPWLFYSQFYTGDLYPISGKAVRFMEMNRAGFTLTFSNWYARTMQSGLHALISNNKVILLTGGLLFFPALCCGSALLSRWKQQSPLLVRAYVVTGFLFGAFIVYISGAWFYFYTFHPFSIVGLLLGGISLIPLIRSSSLLTDRVRRYSTVLVPAFLFALFLFCAYTLYIFGVWFFDRYLYPYNILFLLVFAMLIDVLFTTTQNYRTRIINGIVLGSLLISLNCCTGEFKRLFLSTDTKELGYMNLGIWARNYFPAGTVIGSCQSGGLSYFADNLHVVNLDGVVNKASYEALVQKRSMDYIRDMRIRYIVGWPMNLEYLRDRSSGITRNDLIFVKMIDGFRSLGQEWLVYKVYYAPIPNSR